MENKLPPPTPPRKASPPVPPKGAPKSARPATTPTTNDAVEFDNKTNRPKFVKGNQLWQTVQRPRGRPIISDPADLWQKAVNYFKWCDDNPQARAEVIKHQGEGDLIDVPLGRPYSMDGLTIMLGVSGSYFRSRKMELADKEDMKTATPQEIELLDTILLIESVVRTQQVEGAAVGIFKENLISRINGLADNVNQNNSGEVRQNIVVRDAKTADDLKKLDDMLK